ncbi:MAG: glycoside hydrolase family 10 protein [Anaerovoracaceae bacterium]
MNKLFKIMATSILVLIGIFSIQVLPIYGLSADRQAEAAILKPGTEVRGLWVSFTDFKSLGLYNASESTFRANTKKIISRGKYYGINTIYYHCRIYNDATYLSDTFKFSSTMASKKPSYDPLTIFIEEAHKQGIELHAWLNPYRKSSTGAILDPKLDSTNNTILKSVDEVMAYDIDGVHFDDYFYRGYSSTSATTKRANVNKMIRLVYDKVHSKKDNLGNDMLIFGISPAGNYENCMSAGADVKTWLSADRAKTPYIDYLAPQIYWTDKWGSAGKYKMFTERANRFKSLQTNGVPLYIGLAIYRCGLSYSDDKGWKSFTVLRTQVKSARAKGYTGYILFTARFLNGSQTSKQRYYYKGLVKPIQAKSIKISNTNRSVKKGKTLQLKITWEPADTNPKTIAYKSFNKKIATISSKGKIKGIKKGTVKIKASTKNDKNTYVYIKVY